MHLGKSYVFLENSHFDEALREYNEAFEVHGNKRLWSSLYKGYRVRLLASKGDFDQAHNNADEFKREIEKSMPNSIYDYYFMEAIIAFYERRFQEALVFLHKIDLKYRPSHNVQMDFIRARILLYCGNTEEGLKELERLQSTSAAFRFIGLR